MTNDESHEYGSKRLFGLNGIGLFSAVVFSTIVLFYISQLRYENFYTSNWDFGIAEQLLWTGSHGYLLFETGDYSTSYAVSFLQIHSAYLALLISPLYGLFPKPSFLFFLQSFAVSLSIIPLYFILSDAVRDKHLIFLTLAIYITSFGLLSAFFYDFHWELFIPLEYLSMFYLLSHRKYVLSIVPFVAGISTIEAFPLIATGTCIYFAYSEYGMSFLNPVKMVRNKEWIILLAFFLTSFISYVFYRILQFILLPKWLGLTTAAPISIASTGFLPAGLSLGSLATSLIYWIVLYASLAFIPLFSKKHIILMLPLFFGFIFINPNLSSTFGNQYSAISMPILMIGFSQGMSKIQSDEKRKGFLLSLIVYYVILICILLLFNASKYFINPALPGGAISIGLILMIIPLFLVKSSLGLRYSSNYKIVKKHVLRKFNLKRISVVFLIVVIIFNFVLGPLNTNNFHDSGDPGYWISYTPNPEFKYAAVLASEIPSFASVLASDNLFPMVANNPNAYSLLWFPFSSQVMPNLPFNTTNLPDFIFIDSSQNYLPSDLNAVIADSSDYGLLGHVYFNQYPGQIYLYEKNYKGTTNFFNASKLQF